MNRKTRKRHRPLSVLGWAGICFLTLQIGLGLSLDYLVPLVRFPALAQVLRACPPPSDEKLIVCLGSSRFQVGIDPQEIGLTLQPGVSRRAKQGILNASVPSADPILCEQILLQLLQTGNAIEQLVLEVSPETLSRHTEWLYYHCRSFLRADQLPDHLAELSHQGHLLRLVSLRCIPGYYYRHYLLATMGLSGSESNPWEEERIRYFHREANSGSSGTGAGVPEYQIQLPVRPVSSELQAEIDKMLNHQLPRRWLDHYQIEGKNRAALERILSLCRRRSIAVVLVGVPVTGGQRARYTPELDRIYHDYLNQLTANYCCSYVEARDWLPDGFFMDNHHLNPEGKIYFSRLLATRVLA